MSSIIGFILVSFGIALDLIGAIGLVRLPDVYNRLQVATKCVTLGTCNILFGTFLIVGFRPEGIKSLLCIIFLILTAPIAAHGVARGAHRAGVKLWDKSVVDAYAQDKEGEV